MLKDFLITDLLSQNYICLYLHLVPITNFLSQTNHIYNYSIDSVDFYQLLSSLSCKTMSYAELFPVENVLPETDTV